MSTPSRPGGPRPPAPRPARTRVEHTRPAPASHQQRRSAPLPQPAIAPAPVKGSFAAVMSWRALVLAIVIALAVAVVMPSVRVYLDQRAELAELRAQRDAAIAEVNNLNAELARWDDPAFIIAQARERLAYVLPGETPYRVVDPELVVASAPGSAAAARDQDPADMLPWYDTLWASVMEVGQASDAPPVTPSSEEPVAQEPPLTSVDFGG